ncbi:MAG: SusC/RagA family TonB-linked outer membrane protein [Rikenellaceae bacterium]
MNINIRSIVCFALLTALLGVSSVDAQNKKNAKKKEVQYLDVTSVIVDESGEPIENAEMITREGAYTAFSDANGEVTVTSVVGGILLVEAFGYEDVVIELTKEGAPAKIAMKSVELLESSDDVVLRQDGSSTKIANFTGAADTIDGSKLNAYADYNLSNALQGRIAGLVASQDAGSHGANTSTLYIRGQHRDATNTILVLVDGFVRDYNDILPEEVESITVYKDAIGKVLYGSRGANGVLEITTKRGAANKRVVNVKAEKGVSIATRTADYLNSYDYATLYNEASVNDGLSPLYSAETINGYMGSAGNSDLFYPDVDYSDYFLSNSANFTKATIDMAGGNDRIKYSVVGGLLLGGGFEAVGPQSKITRINVRGSIDVKITDELSFVANSAARFENNKYGSLNSATIYSRVGTYLPNEAPLTISAEDAYASLSLSPSLDGSPFFGASTRVVANLLADMVYGGNTESKYNTNHTNLGLRFNLNEQVEGLSFGGDFYLDNTDTFQLGQTDTYATYAVTGKNDDGTAVLTQSRKLNLADSDSREAFTSKRNMGYRGMADFTRSFGDHDLSTGALFYYSFQETMNKNQNVVNTHTTLRADYTYDDKYSAEASFALLGSNRYAKENRYFLSRAFGASAILSKMDFLKNSSVVDYLKLKASYGVLGYDAATSFLLYKQLWANAGTTSFGSANSTSAERVYMVNVASDINWENSTEYNVGLEGIFFDGRLRGEINYFHETRRDMVESITSDVANILGGYIEVDNVGSIRNQGIDAAIEWSQRKGDLNYSVGLNLLISKNKVLDWDDYDYPDDVQKTIGKSTSVMKGYEALGLFGKDVDLEGHATQMFGDYGNGDIAYKDQNGDGIIDARDQVVLGDSFPTGVFGIDFEVNYKGWGLYALGTAEVGVSSWLNNAYYWVDGLTKYSTVVTDRYHEINNPTGSYPRLTTLSADNNFVNSSYWLSSASYFRMKNVQLSYTFSFKSVKAPVDKVKLFVNGTNLFVLSPIKDLDPEALTAGVSTCPIARTVTGGVCVTF